MDSTEIRLLLVEDNPGDARLIRELLKDTGYAATHLRHVTSLREAEQEAGAGGEPHCVLVDLNLPDGEGMASLSHMRELFPHSAIIVLTGMVDDDLAIAALKKGAQSYMNKNELTARELGQVLRTSIERHGFVVRLREADRSMVLRERRFRALVERSNDLTLLVGHDGNVTYMSPVAARVLLGEEVEVERMLLSSLVHPDEAEAVRVYLDHSISRPEQPLAITLRVRTARRGQEVWLEGTITNLLEEPGVAALVLNLHDVTLRHQAEQELQRANSDLEHRVQERTADLRKAEEDLRSALKAEREINDLKTRFVSTASHEFRTPLTAIKNSAALIGHYNADGGNAKIDGHVGRIGEKVHDLTRILESFLSVEKLESGVEQCVYSDFDLRVICAQAVEEMQPLAMEGQTVHLPSEREAMPVRLDRSMTANVLRNLLGNAIKYTPAGGPIELHCTVREGRVHIVVADRGIGIPDADKPHLFERFFRASSAGATQGTGLGLHIVQGYVRLMAGTIVHADREGGGSLFLVDLPQYPAS